MNPSFFPLDSWVSDSKSLGFWELIQNPFLKINIFFILCYVCVYDCVRVLEALEMEL